MEGEFEWPFMALMVVPTAIVVGLVIPIIVRDVRLARARSSTRTGRPRRRPRMPEYTDDPAARRRHLVLTILLGSLAVAFGGVLVVQPNFYAGLWAGPSIALGLSTIVDAIVRRPELAPVDWWTSIGTASGVVAMFGAFVFGVTSIVGVVVAVGQPSLWIYPVLAGITTMIMVAVAVVVWRSQARDRER